MNVVVKNYHGESFGGNACRKMLKESDKLNDPEIYKAVGYFKIAPFIANFKAMNKILNCSFTSGKVGPSLNSHIDELRRVVEHLDISKTLKIHVIVDHLKESLQYS